MKKWLCQGEHGIQIGDCIEKIIEAETPEEAKKLFITFLQENHPVQWPRIGAHNIYIYGAEK